MNHLRTQRWTPASCALGSQVFLKKKHTAGHQLCKGSQDGWRKTICHIQTQPDVVWNSLRNNRGNVVQQK